MLGVITGPDREPGVLSRSPSFAKLLTFLNLRNRWLSDLSFGKSPHGVSQIFAICDPYLRAEVKIGHNIQTDVLMRIGNDPDDVFDLPGHTEIHNRANVRSASMVH